jgi:uncharacterized protein DUF5990
VRIELLGVDCPVLPGVTVGVQRGPEVVDQHPADGTNPRWHLEARLVEGRELRGPYVHGRPGGRFLYLSWLRSPEGMFRRAKLMLDAVPDEVLAAAAAAGLHGRVSLVMPDGSPLCAAVRPPRITWSAL